MIMLIGIVVFIFLNFLISNSSSQRRFSFVTLLSSDDLPFHLKGTLPKQLVLCIG